MEFWKDHPAARVAAIAVLFAAAVALIVIGWRMTGELAGLGIMVLGVAMLLAALAIYNKPFEEPKRRKEHR
ncbi:MAG: hypothetical protein U0L91_04535 [Gemmiger sp.]|uniref:DUF6903 family protein n=1 Tax=Gemmiger sp. TaxID=2049027 RepID=UPI002E78045E|nr:hypothetical protein [Gemmiger sp.]MEE0800528.1 hypothetical protein [Gemmiger sp.]